MDINCAIALPSWEKEGRPENRSFHFCDIGDISSHVVKDEIYK
jgi:hypothetical protein